MIADAIKKAYQQLRIGKWEYIYWAVDLHGTCIISNYSNNTVEFVNDDVIKTLSYLSSLPETKLIIWTSTYDSNFEKINNLFKNNNIRIDYFNENPEISNTLYGDFVKKFYFSIGIDDKFGFNYESDWKIVFNTVFNIKRFFLILEKIKEKQEKIKILKNAI